MGRQKRMLYHKNIQYLLPSIIYLGTNDGFWARSASNMAMELSLDKERLLAIFEGFPEIFRKSRIKSKAGEHFFSLQARYAKRRGTDIGEKERVLDVPALPTDHIKLVLDFVVQMAEAERVGRRIWISSSVSVAAAILAATAAIFAASIRLAH